MKDVIAVNLRELRRRVQLSQEAVAEQVGVARQTVAKWESGETIPDLLNCAALTQLYNVTLDDLVNYSGGDIGVPPKGKHIFGVVKVGDRGQIVLPKKARDLFGISPGDSLLVLGDEAMETRGLALVDPDLFFAHARAWTKIAAHGKGGEGR